MNLKEQADISQSLSLSESVPASRPVSAELPFLLITPVAAFGELLFGYDTAFTTCRAQAMAISIAALWTANFVVSQ